MKKILIGTNNPAKLEDYKRLLSDLDLEMVSPAEMGITETPNETGRDYEENAVIKAKFYYQKTGIPSLVDDGGLEVPALNNEPGVLSHRWIGREMTDEEMIAEIIKRMQGVADDQRNCRLIQVTALATPYGIFTSEGKIEGMVAEKPARKRLKGFPFRSVIFLPHYGKYYCDVTRDEYEILNHRKAAVDKIRDILIEISKQE